MRLRKVAGGFLLAGWEHLGVLTLRECIGLTLALNRLREFEV